MAQGFLGIRGRVQWMNGVERSHTMPFSATSDTRWASSSLSVASRSAVLRPHSPYVAIPFGERLSPTPRCRR